ncbi:hypothetical protein OHW93_09065 [Acinetobacter baumannii]|uniref:hypothetical protein n=1 Tax=Acinetobacter baumannii TaxID=470 RepID=UPI00056DE669|nr:hypothetical protein [Acinetobacter baumannii]EHF3481052.1 hypothetical protein [Acinetobacter baumannii]EHU3427517.1 hypothetical protein [Acinetobacter baumannii]EJB8376922.1 hypothetical protein [Acinetobacter baumannii]EJB8458674.1 hypothetical protein [Acinetobacter baumannii]MDC4270795.1 hypothetical protein [Acinetobacter baumannii]
MFTRTVQTLKNSTDLVQRFAMPEIHEDFELRRLSNKERFKHYILIFKNVVNQKKDWEDVKVVAEFQERNHNLRFNIKISKQYPELASYEQVIEEKINAIINTSSLVTS